jgi:CrcB protein
VTRARPDLLLVVLAGGCVGGLGRYAVTEAWPDHGFPWAVLAVNVAGALVLGVLMGASRPEQQRLRALFGTGFCGALTTFSAVTVTADHRLAEGRPETALLYVAASAVGSLLAAWLGSRAGRRLC